MMDVETLGMWMMWNALDSLGNVEMGIHKPGENLKIQQGPRFHAFAGWWNAVKLGHFEFWIESTNQSSMATGGINFEI